MTAHNISTATSPSLHYRRTGSGPAIIFMHGFPATGDLWNEVIPALEKDFTVLIPDLPGTGQSRLEGEATTIEELADAIKAVMDDAGAATTMLCGHSMGGYIALAFAQKYPEHTAGLSLVHSTAAADDAEKKALRAKTIALIRKGGKEVFVRDFVPTLFGSKMKESHPEKIKEQTNAALSMSDATMIAFYNAMMKRPDSVEALQDMAFPLQWIIGGEDKLIPYGKLKQQTYDANVSFVSIYPHAGHMSMIEYPAQLAADIGAFGRYCFDRTAAHKKGAVL